MSWPAVQFLIDADGNRTGVVLGVEQYEELLAAQEELHCVRAYDSAKAAGEEAIPFEEAIREIEQSQS
jgi:hypothetical protein